MADVHYLCRTCEMHDICNNPFDSLGFNLSGTKECKINKTKIKK